MSFSLEKLKNLILYVGGNPHVPELGETKLWKLIYFIDSTALRENGKSVTGSDFIKYPYGPVPSRGDRAVKQLRKTDDLTIEQEVLDGYRINKVIPKKEPDRSLFDEVELEIIQRVCRKLGASTAAHLSNLSHKEPAWHYAASLQKLDPDLMLYGQCEDSEGL
jgi:uncharacterized phage-associated protein